MNVLNILIFKSAYLIILGISLVIIFWLLVNNQKISKKISKIFLYFSVICTVTALVFYILQMDFKRTYKDGIIALNTHKYGKATLFLARVKKYFPDVDTLIKKIPEEAFYYYIEKIDTNINNIDISEQYLDSASKWNPKTLLTDSIFQKISTKIGKLLFIMGKKAFYKKDYELALNYLNDAKERGYKVNKNWFQKVNKKLAEEYFKKGLELYKKESYYFAEEQFKMALKFYPKFTKAKRWLKKAQYWANMTPEQREYEKAIQQHKIMIGMTKEQVIRAWGKPNDINRTVFKDLWGVEHVHEQWIYGIFPYSETYLYFEDGILTSWQD